MHRDPYPVAAPPDLYEWTLLIRSLETVPRPARTRRLAPGWRAVIPVGYLLNILKRAPTPALLPSFPILRYHVLYISNDNTIYSALLLANVKDGNGAASPTNVIITSAVQQKCF